MSAKTYEKLEEAIREHCNDELPGAYLTDWAVMTSAAVMETAGRTRYYAEYSESPHHTHLGLAHMLLSDVQIQGSINTVDPEDGE